MTAEADRRGALSPAQARAMFRAGSWQGGTRGFCLGYLQCGIVMLPPQEAQDFLLFCTRNPQALPLLDVIRGGDVSAGRLAPEADLRFDLPRYHVYRNGELCDDPLDVARHWRDDLVTFVLGCSLTFDAAMLANEIPYRQLEETGQPTMYLTGIDCEPAGAFAARLVVSMRPMLPRHAIRAIQVTSRYPRTHGAPVHFGDPAAIGIADIDRPDIGSPVSIRPGEVPVFWACIATIWDAARRSRPSLFISHAPGCMFITDRRDESVAVL
ncbi:putative hydro-lyase [Pigmentiphaga soli]|uniref:Hydro-lyase n=1 Tax=Pigmentiphaga soli TaxID=1007095 RepID=A0ABP8GFE3_9BURK